MGNCRKVNEIFSIILYQDCRTPPKEDSLQNKSLGFLLFIVDWPTALHAADSYIIARTL